MAGADCACHAALDELHITAEHPAVELLPSLYRLEGEIAISEKSESVGTCCESEAQIVVVAKLNGVVIQEVPAVKRGPHFFYSMVRAARWCEA